MIDRPGGSAASPSVLPWIVVLGVLWGATFPIARLGVLAGGAPFLLVTVDFLLAAAIAAVLAVGRRVSVPSARSLAESAGIGALMIGGINLPLFWGIRFATGGAASIVYATSPAISLAFLLVLQRGPRPSPVRVLALGIGLLGVFTLGVGAGAGGPISNPWALAAFGLGATCQGIGAVVMSLRRPAGEGWWGRSAQFAGAGAIALLALPVLGRSVALPWTVPVIGSILYFAGISLVLGYTIFFRILARSGAISANLVTFLNPIVALALGIAAFGESLGWTEVAGLALVLAALTGIELSDRSRSPPSPTARPVPWLRRRWPVTGRSTGGRSDGSPSDGPSGPPRSGAGSPDPRPASSPRA